MGISFSCDGCGQHLDEDKAHKRGVIEFAYYGDCCDGKWQELDNQLRAVQVDAAKAYEQKRAVLIAKAKQNGLAKVADDA